jgi:hypothetical protein
MSKLFKSLCVAGIFVLLLTGASSALTEAELDELKGTGQTVIFTWLGMQWGSLHVELMDFGDDLFDEEANTLVYKLTNDGTFNADMHMLEMQIDPGAVPEYGYIGGDSFMVDDSVAGSMQFWFSPGIVENGFSQFWVRSVNDVDYGDVFLQNTFAMGDSKAAALLVNFTGHPITDVPEPATLLLLGGGFLGVGAFRYLRRRRVG